MPPAVPVRGGKTGYGTNGATAPAGSAVTAGPRPAAERGLCRVPAALRGGGAPAGAAGPIGNPPVPLLRPCQNPVPAVPGSHRGQPDPGGRQSRVDGRNRLRSQPRQRPGRWNGQLRHRMARANLDPLPARIGLTDQIPLPNKGFPSGFLVSCLERPEFDPLEAGCYDCASPNRLIWIPSSSWERTTPNSSLMSMNEIRLERDDASSSDLHRG